MKKQKYEHDCSTCKYRLKMKTRDVELVCGIERPPRDVLCQLKERHEGRHRAVIFWEEKNER